MPSPSLASVALLLAAALMHTPSTVAAASANASTTSPLSARIETLAGAIGVGPATAIGMDVSSVAAGAGTVVVGGGSIVRRVDLATGAQHVVAGTGGGGTTAEGASALDTGITDVSGVAVAPDGSVVVAEHGAARVRRVRGGVVTTIAGTGEPGSSGDGGPARAARLRTPQAVAVAPDGTVFVADPGTASVRRVRGDGTIDTIAGSGARGSTGDGGPAALAALDEPEGLAVDPAGRLYIADRGAHRIRRVDFDGTITTVAGSGAAGFSGDGGPATAAALAEPSGVAIGPDGLLYIADSANHRVRRVEPDGTIRTIAGNDGAGYWYDGADARFATLWRPRHLAFHDGELLIADQRNARVRRLTSGNRLTTVLGNGSSGWSGDGGPATAAQLAGPFGLDLAADGALVLADSQNHRVRRVAPDGRISTVAGGADWFAEGTGDGGPATSARLRTPAGLAVAPDGGIFVSELGDSVVRRIAPDGTISTHAGTWEAGHGGDGGPADAAALRIPHGLAVDPSGTLYIADTGNHRVRAVSPDGTIRTLAGTGVADFGGDGGRATDAALHHPVDVAVGVDGTVYIADSGNGRIRAVRNGVIRTVAGSAAAGHGAGHGDGGSATAASIVPDGVSVDEAGRLYIADRPGLVRRVDRDGTISTIAGTGAASFGGDGGAPTRASLSWPRGLAVAQDGARTRVYIADWGNNRVRLVTADTAVEEPPAGPAPAPTGPTDPAPPPVLRLAGPDRFATAVAVSRAEFADLAAGAVVLARGDSFPDALAGAPLAARLRAPLLLTSNAHLDAVTQAEVQRVLRAGGVVHLLGGTGAIQPAVATRLEQLGYRVVRHGGADRFATATAIAEAIGRPALVVLTTGTDFPDAVSAGAVAAAHGGAVLLTAGGDLPPATSAFLGRHPGVRQVAIGGPAARAVPAAEPVIGRDRFATAAKAAERFFPTATSAGIASGTAFPDALTGGAQMGRLGGPLLLVGREALPGPTHDYLTASRGPFEVRIYGGTAAVGQPVAEEVSRVLRR